LLGGENIKTTHKLFTFHILTYGIELFTCRQIIGGNVDGKRFGALIGRHGVFTEQFDTNITNDNSKTGGEDTCDWVNVQLNDNPSGRTSYAHDGDENECFRPMLDGETALPIESVRTKS
jgi:hypothetical protein